MKKLTLMRHAKSSWADFDIPDVDRTLGERGRKAAELLGGWLETSGRAPDHVIVSSATRCQETWELVSASLTGNSTVSTEAALYSASPEEILDIIRKTATGDNVLVIGHMPGIGSLARALRVDPAPAHADFEKYPSGATTVLEIQGEWAALDYGTSHLDTYITPAELG
ncbi:MAG: histidine phosphatase family protein [Rhodobacteraceae bacterium]|nr:histidine phosphatase family protein [Paracoccaceae bacterium]